MTGGGGIYQFIKGITNGNFWGNAGTTGDVMIRNHTEVTRPK